MIRSYLGTLGTGPEVQKSEGAPRCKTSGGTRASPTFSGKGSALIHRSSADLGGQQVDQRQVEREWKGKKERARLLTCARDGW